MALSPPSAFVFVSPMVKGTAQQDRNGTPGSTGVITRDHTHMYAKGTEYGITPYGQHDSSGATCTTTFGTCHKMQDTAKAQENDSKSGGRHEGA